MEKEILIASDLSKKFNGKDAVINLNLTIKEGEIVGLLGPNGAGKTTSINMMYGITAPTHGDVILNGYSISKNPKEAKRKIGVTTQDDRTDPDINVYENIFNFAYFFGITGKKAKTIANELIDKLGLKDYKKNTIDSLSGGYKRRVSLARALINNPNLLFLDEPTTGLDPDIRQELWRIILEFKSENRSVLLTTHYMDEAYRLCDRVLIFNKGSVIDQGVPDEIIKRHIGEDVFEISREDEWVVTQLLSNQKCSILNLGADIVIVPEHIYLNEVRKELHNKELKKLIQRKAQLDDVFIKLSGENK